MKNTMYRKAYDTYLGVKNEALAYDFWCKGWDAAVEEIQRKESIAQTDNCYSTTKTKHYKAFR
jgi:hypothetical protein